ncbi:MAG: right-handed parallel beta-helix repeat-containing protein, partial [Candidatus Latescibacteria bacterium]|nr:right-handed parallel beta-helix repeat-containing protein [Candidatus Latescibacterota bacterium]
IGSGAISVSGGDRETLTRCEHTIENNHIHHCAQQTQHPCITISGVGIRTANNHIHHSSDAAIQLSGNEHLVTYNRIHHVCLETEDVGAVFMQRDWTERGIRIQHNFFHDLNSSGIYMNDCASGSVIIGNIFARCTRAVFIGGGRNHRIENNIFVHCEPAIQIDGRGLDNQPEWHTMIYEIMKPSFEAMHPLEPPYKDRYPELVEIAIYYQADTGIPPEGNLVVRNVCHGGEWLKTHWNAEPKFVAIQNNITDEDPLFTDAESDNYTLQEDSPAYELGFKPIPHERIGLHKNK